MGKSRRHYRGSAGGTRDRADSLITPENWAYNPDVPKFAYDPVRAAALLDEAGWRDSDGDGVRDKDGIPAAFCVAGRGRQPAPADRRADPPGLGAHWDRRAGDAGLFCRDGDDFLAPRTFEAVLTDWDQLGDPDPYPQWHSTQIGAGQNYTGWHNAQADALMEQARAMSDESKRKPLYQEFQTLFAENCRRCPSFIRSIPTG